MIQEIKQSPITKEEYESLYKIPAIYSNRFYVSLAKGGLRITFAEIDYQESFIDFRSAVILPLDAVKNLHKILGKLLELEPKKEEPKKEEPKKE